MIYIVTVYISRAWRFARGHATCGWGTSCWDPNLPLGGASWPLPLCDIDINKRASTARTVWIVFHFCIDHDLSLTNERRAQISLSDFTHLFGYFLSTFSSCSADIFIYIRTFMDLYKNSENTRTFRGRSWAFSASSSSVWRTDGPFIIIGFWADLASLCIFLRLLWIHALFYRCDIPGSL